MNTAWVVSARRVVFSGGPIVEVAIESVTLPSGQQIADYYQIRMADYALVFALTVEGDILLFRQYKHGVGRVCVGLPGGALHPGEEPLAAAKRELLEETGFAGSEWEALGGFVTNGNQHCNVAHLFIARGCRRVAEPTAPDVESPELLRIPRAELWSRVALAEVGQVSHVALLMLATHPVHGRS